MQKNRKSGFSLIEIIGVMAIMAILISAIAPALVQKVKRAYTQKEQKSLENLADALKEAIIRTQTIPSALTWSTTLAPYVAVPQNDIITSENGNRRYIVDPAATDIFPLPYDQQIHFRNTPTSLPTTAPSSIRIILFSDFETPVATTSLSATDFNNIWDQPNSTPPTNFNLLTKESQSLKRINYTTLFYPITINVTNNTNMPQWSLNGDNSNRKSLISGVAPLRYWLLKGSEINLFQSNTLMLSHTLQSPITLNYDGFQWEID